MVATESGVGHAFNTTPRGGGSGPGASGRRQVRSKDGRGASLRPPAVPEGTSRVVQAGLRRVVRFGRNPACFCNFRTTVCPGPAGSDAIILDVMSWLEVASL